jgi:hypothetical protein
LLSFLPLPYRTCTVHVSVGEVKLVTVLMHSNQLVWAGLGPGQKNIYIYIYIYINILWFLSVLFYAILFNYWSVFYVIKNTNPVLKYPIFVNLKTNLKKYFCAYDQVSQS